MTSAPLVRLEIPAAGPPEPPPDRMIASGMLAARAAEFARHDLHEAARRVQGEWAAVLCEQA
jgi:hypothetical protein